MAVRRHFCIASVLVALILIQTCISAPNHVMPSSENLSDKNGQNNLVNNGDGTWTVTYDSSQDTTLDSTNPSTVMSQDPILEVGHFNALSSQRTSILGLDLSSAGFWTNVTIVNASLDLKIESIVDSADIHVWKLIRENWNVDEATWISRNSSSTWEYSGGLGNLDSGGLMDRKLIDSSDSVVSLNVTRALKIGQYRQLNGLDPRAGVLLTSGGDESDSMARFYSYDDTVSTNRPIWNITFHWTPPTMLTTQPSWVDIYPKPIASVDIDGQINFEGTIRSEAAMKISAGLAWSSDRNTIDLSGQLSVTQAGITTVTASCIWASGVREVVVFPGTPLDIVALQSNYSITVDDIQEIHVVGLDQYGNHVSDIPISWSASSGIISEDGFYTPTSIGTHTVAGNWGGHIAIVNVTVGVGLASNIILPEGLTARAGVGFQITPQLEDKLGNPLPLSAGAGLFWNVEKGNIDGSGYFMGQEIGVWQINVTSGTGANGTGWITVTPGLIDYLEIVGPNRVVGADEVVPLDLRWHDLVGNNESVVIPISNWSAGNGNFRMGDGIVEWLPNQEGEWVISVIAEGEEALISVTVENGEIVQVWIDVVNDIITADGETELILQAEDSRGNRWSIPAQWSVVEPEASSSLVEEFGITHFVGKIAGEWTIQALHQSSEGTYNVSSKITVLPGRLARIVIPGDGTSISCDDAFSLSPVLTDADGNNIEDVTLNWTINGESFTQEILLSGNIWMPVEVGNYLIEADAAGRFAQSRITVYQGEPYQIVIESSLEGFSTNSGVPFNLTTYAEDLDGNRAPWPVEWEVSTTAFEIQETAWSGVYEVRGLKEGAWDIVASNGTASGTISIEVITGDPVGLRVGPHSGGGNQGESISMMVELVDYGGNSIPLQPAKLEFETNAGTFLHDEGPYWNLQLEEAGETQLITIRYQSWETETFVDVEATGLDRLTETTSGQMLLGGFATAIVVIGILFFIVRNRENSEDWEGEYEWDELSSDANSDSELEDSIPQDNPVYAGNDRMTRQDRRRLSHQRKQQRIRELTDATEQLQSTTTIESSAQSASATGVLQAVAGTVQGQSGWYVTSQGENQYWEVDSTGRWNRRN